MFVRASNDPSLQAETPPLQRDIALVFCNAQLWSSQAWLIAQMTRWLTSRANSDGRCGVLLFLGGLKMEKFDRYDAIDYTGNSNPNIWEIHLEFFFSKAAALKRYATIKRLHPEAAKRTVIRPFLRPNGDIQIHRDMIKDFTPETEAQAEGVWQFEFWLPSTEQQAADFEKKMSQEDPEGWTEHRNREKRSTRNMV
jgi:hypothetical protein